MIENNKFDKLLKEIRSALKQNREIEKLSGENFNLFVLLEKHKDEVKTHSAFISELLNPEGSHGMGGVFLELFLKMLIDNNFLKDNSINNLDNTKVEIEKHVGNILDINSRLDIYISNKNLQICIENKIYAKDQEKQLERYIDFLNRDKLKENLLIYLTLFGKEYSNSNLEKETDYICLSYKKEILQWLKDCLKESVQYPILRETIAQYINLIKNLTNQLMSDKMSTQIQKIILTDIESAEAIKNQYDDALKKVINDFKAHIINELNEYFLDYNIICYSNSWRNFTSVLIKSKEKDFEIGIESFNGQGHFEGELFIGAIDFKKKNQNVSYTKGGWITGSIETIWSKQNLFYKLQGFANGSSLVKETLINEILKVVIDYISRYWGINKVANNKVL